MLYRLSIAFPTIAAAAIVASSASAALQSTTSGDPSDWSVMLAVERELAHDAGTPAHRLDVAVDDGIVTLEGTVADLLARDRATRLARTVRGVSAVVDRIAVSPPASRSDAAIREDVERSLLYDPATESYEVTTVVEDGVVTLAGAVDSWREAQLCLHVAKGVRGVVDVVDAIEIEYTTDRGDAELRAEIVKGLEWNVLVDADQIEVEVEDGEVRLSGTVDSASERWEARSAAWTSGVESVDVRDLRVLEWSAEGTPGGQPVEPRSDEAIRAAVERRLDLEPRVDPAGISMAVVDGHVAITGTVHSLGAERAAVDCAASTSGVRSVESYIKVRLAEEPSDAEITERLDAALLRDAVVERFDLATSVYDGTVYLSGTVDSAYERARAESIAAHTEGVERVVDLLDIELTAPIVYDPWVDPWPFDGYPIVDLPLVAAKPDAELAEDIETEYFWSPFVDGDAIEVTVEDGVATLTGTVDDRSERSAAVDNAYEAGAARVRDQLELR